MRNPICLLLTLWRTLRTGAWRNGQFVIGCDGLALSDGPENILLTRCRRCGKTDVAWAWPEQVPPLWRRIKEDAARADEEVGDV